MRAFSTQRAAAARLRALAVAPWWVLACGSPQAQPLEPLPSSEPKFEAQQPQVVTRAAQQSADEGLARELGDGLVRACPAASDAVPPSVARQRCADALTALATLRDALHDPVLWGAQRPDAGYDIEKSQTTQMNALVLRRMYLSTFAFEPEYHVVQSALGLVLHVPIHFRQGLDPGDYPYPFWHSADKWRSYERSRELLFFIARGEVNAVLRSADQDLDRPHVEQAWDGRWRWQSARGEEPRNALYATLFSPSNPHVAELDAAYRAFEAAQRPSACVSCHDPSNRGRQNPLELFSYPNQALTGRHDIVRELADNAMPPATPEAPAGIGDDVRRDELLRLARRFAELGDAALSFEGERVIPEVVSQSPSPRRDAQ